MNWRFWKRKPKPKLRTVDDVIQYLKNEVGEVEKLIHPSLTKLEGLYLNRRIMLLNELLDSIEEALKNG